MNDVATNPTASFSLQSLIASLSFGLIAGMQTIFIQVSIAALVFAGPLEPFAAAGIGFFFFGSFVMSAIGALASSSRTAVAYPQEAPVAIVAVIAAALAASLSGGSQEQIFATVVAAMMLATVLTGIFFWLMGRFQLGQLARYIPYPVGGGFLGGTGWLLLVGGIGVMADVPLGLGLLQPEILLRWAPGFLFGLTLLLVLRRFSHYLLLPSLVIGSIGLFYLCFYLLTGSIQAAGPGGWLLGPLPSGGLWQPETMLVVAGADWGAIANNALNMSTVLLISIVGLLLNASGLEISTRTDMDLNRELRIMGVANLLAGLGGSPVGFHSLSLSSLGHRLGVRSRLGGLVVAALCLLALLFGAGTLAVFPKLIAGGFLIFLGFSFLIEWVYDTWFTLPKVDYALIWLILITIVTVGFLEGVAVGILVAVVLFVIDYSRINPVRHTLTGAQRRSRTVRPRLYEGLLRQRGDRIYIVVLHGFLFFGSANRLLDDVRARFDAAESRHLRYLVVDFRLVTGVDASASFAFERLTQLAESQGTELVLTHLSPSLQKQLLGEPPADGDVPGVRLFPDLDRSLAWCEEQLLHTFEEVGLAAKLPGFVEQIAAELPGNEAPADWLDQLRPGAAPTEPPLLARLRQQLQRIEVATGEYLVHQGQEMAGLYVLDAGQASIQFPAEDGTPRALETLTEGALIGALDLYRGERATADVVALQPCVFTLLSLDDLRLLEREEPQLAIAIHRVLAGMLEEQVARTTELAQALQR